MEAEMRVPFVLIVCLCALTEGVSVYVDRSDPYGGPGPLGATTLRLLKGSGGSPLDTVVHLPTAPGTYAPVFFVEGLDGIIPAEIYKDYLGGLASHGFVALAPDYVIPAESRSEVKARHEGLGFITESYTAQLLWMRANLNAWLASKGTGVKVDWNYLALSSHSAGADCVHKMAANLTGDPKAVVLHGPFSSTFKEPMNHSLPVLMLGTEFATHHAPYFPPCILPGMGMDHFWQMWTQPPKISMVIKGFGHCDLTDFGKSCDKFKVCVSGNGTESHVYRQYAIGVTSAFLVDFMLGYTPSAKYVLDNSTMPVTVLQRRVDLK